MPAGQDREAYNPNMASTMKSPDKRSTSQRPMGQHLTVTDLSKSEPRTSGDHALTMPPQKSNPFEIIPASSTSQISPSPARNSVKSHGSQHRLSMSAGRNARSVSFAGSSKPGAKEVESAGGDTRAILNERVAWQNLWLQRFLELPQVDPSLHSVSLTATCLFLKIIRFNR